ncbi:dihydrolipoyl dehydrogenase [Pseudomonas sp. 102515]|uniref:dihydrolipoyl dehydrogenase n=1 Tax=Pseudomonas sp. 102515 TaxID=3071568 RepID=UPI002800FA15|nr:dihydrolipoyl dehydrogenase [Pseudomonas sp. 102515]MDQ7914823.1 dihydrolipoyl dehydrogenase [Pseudomonas sp. 102515]
MSDPAAPSPSADLECDVAVIGAGTAGLAAERAARRQGARTLLIDDRWAGTTCASVGCMPSKLLIVAGEAHHAVRRAGTFGIEVGSVSVDGAAVMARVRRERDHFVAATKQGFAKLPEGVAQRATARFVAPDRLQLSNGKTIKARTVVIATGSYPLVPEPFAALGERALTNETIFELPDLPRSLAVIGTGPVGLELAQAMARLGVAVTLFGQDDGLGALKDLKVKAELRKILEQDMTVLLNVEVDARRDGEGVRLSWSGAASGEGAFDYVLVAAGRPPRLKGLGLETTGIALDDHGTPVYDPETMQCGASSIFIAGDADHDRPILHEASDEGAIAGHNAACYPGVRPTPRSPLFSLIFTDPPVAVLGSPPDEGSLIGTSSYHDQGRARVEARNQGIARLYAEPGTGKLTGAAMVGPGMDHIGHLLVLALIHGETASSLLDMPFYHPTLEEGLKSGLREICKAAHSSLRDDRDQGSPSGA